MSVLARVVGVLCVVGWMAQADGALAWQPAVVGSVELTDAAGDVGPIVYVESVGSGPDKEVKYPGFDVLKLAVSSDGTTLTFAATLNAPPGNAASEVLEFHIDTDNNRKTGVTYPFESQRLAGLEFYGTLDACLEHDLFGTTCAGTTETPRGHSAIVTLEKYGTDWMFKDAVLDIPAAGAVKAPKTFPVQGTLIRASVPYAAIGLKPGRTIRLVVREASTAKVDNLPQGFFPDIVLTLK